MTGKFITGRNNVFFCGKGNKNNKKKDPHKLHVLDSSNTNFEKTVRAQAANRFDEWKEEVLERVALVLANNESISSAKVVYHNGCKFNFSQPSKGVPKMFANKKTESQKGRNFDVDKTTAFDKTMKYFLRNEDGNFSISDLVKQMAGYLAEMGSDVEPYSNRYMKVKMVEHFGHDLILTSLEGKSCVAT